MKFKIGDIVSLLDNNSEKVVVARSRFENLTEESLRVLTAKTNILELKVKISNIELGNFTIYLFNLYPLLFQKKSKY